MNFFAHYYFDQRLNKPWHNVGLLFPDLLRIFTKSQRISENRWSKNKTSCIPGLAEGIEKHFRADDRFHNWLWFIEMNKELALKIRESNLGLGRDWFISHIFIELAIDHVLVSENQAMVDNLYFDLESCKASGWEVFFNEQAYQELELWLKGYQKFTEHRYIFTYKDTHSVIYALSRIYENTGVGIINDIQSEFLLVLLNDFIPVLKTKMKELNTLIA